MAGYDWKNGKSNNATDAEHRGCFPKSKINKILLDEYNISLSVKEVKKLIELGIFNRSEWHHTSSFFNETDYYDLNHLSEMLEDDEEHKMIIEALLKSDEIQESEKQEDIIYAEVEVTDFIKSNRRWLPSLHTYIAKIEGCNNKIMPKITTTSGDVFRKKNTNFKILKYIEKSEFEKSVEKHDALREKEIKELKKSVLLEEKNRIIKNNIDILKKEHPLFSKLHRARTMKSIENIKKEIESEIIIVRKEAIKRLSDIDISEWLSLSSDKQHPAPEYIVDMKRESGLSWNGFINFLQETKKVA